MQNQAQRTPQQMDILVYGTYNDVHITYGDSRTVYENAADKTTEILKTMFRLLWGEHKADDSFYQPGIAYRIHLDRLTFEDAQMVADAIYNLATTPQAKSTAYLTTIQAWYGAQNWSD